MERVTIDPITRLEGPGKIDKSGIGIPLPTPIFELGKEELGKRCGQGEFPIEENQSSSEAHSEGQKISS